VRVDLLVCMNHGCATMEENVEEIAGLSIELFGKSIGSYYGVVEPLVDSGVKLFLIFFTFFCLLLPLGRGCGGRF